MNHLPKGFSRIAYRPSDDAISVRYNGVSGVIPPPPGPYSDVIVIKGQKKEIDQPTFAAFAAYADSTYDVEEPEYVDPKHGELLLNVAPTLFDAQDSVDEAVSVLLGESSPFEEDSLEDQLASAHSDLEELHSVLNEFLHSKKFSIDDNQKILDAKTSIRETLRHLNRLSGLTLGGTDDSGGELFLQDDGSFGEYGTAKFFSSRENAQSWADRKGGYVGEDPSGEFTVNKESWQ